METMYEMSGQGGYVNPDLAQWRYGLSRAPAMSRCCRLEPDVMTKSTNYAMSNI
jgi:hypothetical protein